MALGGVANSVIFEQDFDGTYSGAISGAGGIIKKTGTGTLKLTGALTNTGTMFLEGGTVTVQNTAATPISTQNVTNRGVLHIDQNGPAAGATIAGVISNGGSFLKTGTGTLNFTSGANTYTGGTTVSGGVLTGAAGTDLQGDIVNNATVTFNGAGTGYPRRYERYRCCKHYCGKCCLFRCKYIHGFNNS